MRPSDIQTEVTIHPENDDLSQSEGDETQEAASAPPRIGIASTSTANPPAPFDYSKIFGDLAENPHFIQFCQGMAVGTLARHPPPVAEKPPEQGKAQSMERTSTIAPGNPEDEIQEIHKSPSMTTVYTPALRMRRTNQINLPNFEDGVEPLQPQASPKQIEEIVTNCLEKFSIGGSRPRVQSVVVQPGKSDQPKEHDVQERVPPLPTEEERAMSRVEKSLLNAEKFKASVATPRGKVPEPDYNCEMFDNKFSSTTSHVDQPTREKIEVGGFVEVEKLIPKTKTPRPDGEDKRMDLVTKEGYSYFVPFTERDQKVNNVKKWEQGFRAYATIYSEANPHRAAEIWRYVHTINDAAATFQWDNVAWYDYQFRQEMAEFPQRCWSRINGHLWVMCMKDHITNKFGHFQKGNNNKQVSKQTDPKQRYCWKFNKNKCRNPRCPFDHRCSYCGSHNHIALACPKKTQQQTAGSNDDKDEKQTPAV